ncbi:receptor-like cytoplasmic kinase 176 isoform X2 [Cicer arietinum]|uniref:receptor-like cytoplasmic kinase 176 isoform X2 n=1 Tax=Cicer arietinum TaxID=3827 RepID=UPI003CC6297B
MVNDRNPSTHNMLLGFIAGISTVLALALLMFCLFWKRVIPFFNKPKNLKGKEFESLKYEKISIRCFNLEELERATKNFSQDCLLGSGAFEVRLLSAVKHKNLIGLVGYCEEPEREGAKILVYEYVPNGSLLEYMIGNTRRSLTWKQRINIAIGAAKGIAYLHEEMKPSIIHRDIKPSNILLGENFEAKVSDFGLVKSGPTGDQSHVSSQIKGTPGYLDPAYCSSCHLTKFSDVYSFGVILLQLISARPAVDNAENQSNQHIIDWARPSIEKGNIDEIMDANLFCQSEPCNMKVMLKMGQLAIKCIAQEPKHRPTMTQVCKELEQAHYSDDSFSNKEPETRGSVERYDCSQSFVSLDGVGLEKFHVDMDSFSFKSTNLRCLENNSFSIDIDKNNVSRI